MEVCCYYLEQREEVHCFYLRELYFSGDNGTINKSIHLASPCENLLTNGLTFRSPLFDNSTNCQACGLSDHLTLFALMLHITRQLLDIHSCEV